MKSYSFSCLRSRSVVTQHSATLVNYSLTDWKTDYKSCGWIWRTEAESRLFAYPSSAWCVNKGDSLSVSTPVYSHAKQSECNYASSLFFFPEHFVLALICSLPCISIVALHLFPLKTMRKRELCAGFNSICVEICCNICLAAGQVKYSHFIKWRYATVIAHLVSRNDSIYCGALWRCCGPNSANVHVREALAW